MRRARTLAPALLAALAFACAHAPPPAAKVHVVQRGDTPASIARRYQVDVDALMRLNEIRDPTKLAVGQRLVLPARDGADAIALEPSPRAVSVAGGPVVEPRPSPSPSPSPVSALDDEADRAVARLLGGGGGADRDRAPGEVAPGPAAPSPSPRPTAAPVKPAVLPPPPAPDLEAMRATFTRSPRAGKSTLVWPVEGVVVSLFGTRDGQRHDGIDIGAPQGTAVWAAADGEVVFAGEQPGYGLLVIVAHEGELATVYAHNAANLVKKGDRVRQGDPIAQVGQTGGAASPAVHFEVRRARVPQNPLAVLPDD